MRVILIKDVKNLGRQWEIKRVTDGYARNYLLPRGVVKPATQEALDELEGMMRLKELEATRTLQRFEDLVSELDGFELDMPTKADVDGNLYGAIDGKAIVARLKEMDFDVPKSAVKLADPIKKTGEYKVVLEFDHGLEAELKINIKAESSK